MEQTKISVKVYSPLLHAFGEQLKGLRFKRDKFLNDVLRGEIKHLEKDLKDKRQSDQARLYISRKLQRMGTRPINVVVDKDVAQHLDRVVEKSNLVRDAFINRLIVFLRSSNSLLDSLGLPKHVNSRQFNSSVEEMPTSPLRSIEAVLGDPMYYLRVAAQERWGEGLYSVWLGETYDGFSCYLDDENVPGTTKHKKASLDADLMLEELGAFESGSAAYQVSKAKQLVRSKK